ncbi:hypothetical protein [Roseateles sp.]|uniref:hypothetical protein n=1 Tax=Roseateles sp. TaxID=1971397 RepID=UPI003955162C
MNLHLLSAALRCGLAALVGLTLAVPAQAAPVTYSVQGHFTGATSDDPTLVAAIAPLLGAGQSLSLTLSLDNATASSGITPGLGATMYPAITATGARFAGFDDATSSGCASPSDFICSLHIRNGAGGFSAPDQVSLFPAILRSTALEAASGLGRPLSLQLMSFFTDFSGSSLSSDALDVDLSTLPVSGWSGQFGVFMLRDGGGFDRASFAFSVDSVTPGVPSDPAPQPLPAPGSLALSLLALAGLALRGRKTGGPTA